MKDENTRNTILAMALSLLVLLGWQFLVVKPRMEEERQRQAVIEAQKKQETGAKDAPSAAPMAGPAIAPVSIKTRTQAIAENARVVIDTPSLSGSINLKGGRIDDLALKNYHDTVDPKSPRIGLFSPSGTSNAYYAEMGYVSAPGTSLKMPGPNANWNMREGYALSPDMPIRMEYNNGQGLTFRRTYSVDGNYMFTIEDEVLNNRSEPVTLYPYALVSRHGTPHVQGVFVLHEGLIGVLGESGLKEITYKNIDKSLQEKEKATQGWVGITDKYWAAAVIPDQKTPFEGRFSTQESGQQKIYQSDYLLNAQTVQPGATLKTTHRLFAGAKEVATIDKYKRELSIDRFDLLIDWGWFYFFTKPLFWIIDYLFKLIGNFGVAILLVTVLVKTVFYPLASRSYASMAQMKKVQPEMTQIRERYADDKMKQQQELMELYKREKINPVSGCLPVLIQIPVFFALYKVLYVSIEMRHAPFFGWIRDLSAPDPTSFINLFGLLPFVAPPFLHIGVWPLIMGVTMFLQMKMNPAPTDPAQKIIFSWMPLLFTFLLASFPAGLVIYWAWNNLLSIIQQWIIMRRMGVKVELFDNLRGTFTRKKKADSTAAKP